MTSAKFQIKCDLLIMDNTVRNSNSPWIYIICKNIIIKRGKRRKRNKMPMIVTYTINTTRTPTHYNGNTFTVLENYLLNSKVNRKNLRL